MLDHRVILGFLDYGSEILLLGYLLFRVLSRRSRGLSAIAAYMAASLAVGGTRLYAASHFGARSDQYGDIYWLTDFLLVLSVFLLICYFFRRACKGGAPRLWPHVRLMLSLVFFLTAVVSLSIVYYHEKGFYPYFVLEFQQDLYFVCLVLATMLYLLLVQYSPGDDQLGLLVCGLGIQCAGCAAPLALYHVLGSTPVTGAISGYIIPLSDIGMALVWFYTSVRVPWRVTERARRRARKALPVEQLAHIG